MPTTLTSHSNRSLFVSHMTGHRRIRVQAPEESTIGELINVSANRLGTPTIDSAGRPMRFTLRLDRDGSRLHHSQAVGDLQEGDGVTLLPNIEAGAMGASL